MPTGLPTVLDDRALNRALLSRQLLLERSPHSPLAAIEHLVGLQAQLPMPPYFGLWARLAKFDPEELSRLYADRRVVRIAAMRSTVHLISADDCLRLRPVMQPASYRAMTPRSRYGRALAGVDLDELERLGRQLVEAEPQTGAQIAASLALRWPGVDADALAFGVRARVPLVQVPPRGQWRRSGQARLTSAEHWIGRPLQPPDVAAVVRRYLAAYGPAGVADAQVWSGLSGLRSVFESLRTELLTFRSESGAELFDLPDAPRPSGELPAPVRLLPEFDNILLSHDERSRIYRPVHRRLIFTVNGIIHPTVLVDGFVRAVWKLRTTTRSASIEVSLLPGPALGRRDRAAIDREARALLAQCAPGSSYEVSIGEPQPG